MTDRYPRHVRLALRAADIVAPELAKIPRLLTALPETTGNSTPGRPDSPLTCIPATEWHSGRTDVVVVGS
ncbi:hypothetical protein ACFQ1S_15925, partial [Kibdelosporangium lantanae]